MKLITVSRNTGRIFWAMGILFFGTGGFWFGRGALALSDTQQVDAIISVIIAGAMFLLALLCVVKVLPRKP